MRINNFLYLCKEGVRNLFSNKLMSFACVGVLIACLLLIGSAVLFTLNVNSVVTYVEQQNEVVVFLDENMQSSDIEILSLSLRNMDNILDITFMSRQESLERLQERLDTENRHVGIFDGLGDDTLFDTYIVRVEDLNHLGDTVARLREIDGVIQVNAATDVANILLGLNRAVQFAGAVVVGILVAVSVVIITNTIKLNIYNRRKEINIMKYVGATDSFIRMPFLIEGMLIGLIAAVLAFFMLGFGYTYLISWLYDNHAATLGVILDNAVEFMPIARYMIVGFAILGVFIGIAGSGIFVRRHLRV